MDDFRQTMMSNIDERSAILQGYVETVLAGLQAVANLLTTKKVKSRFLISFLYFKFLMKICTAWITFHHIKS